MIYHDDKFTVIMKNCVRCIHCHDIIQSEDNERKTCGCGIVTICGGTDSLIRESDQTNYEELSVVRRMTLHELNNELDSVFRKIHISSFVNALYLKQIANAIRKHISDWYGK